MTTMNADNQPTIQNLNLLFGELDHQTALEILALNPLQVELEQAALWLSGGGDILARSGQPQTARIRAILDLLDDEEDED
jgi:hypothetical protein